MKTYLSLERADGYFNSEWRASRAPWVKPSAPFITISRECCAGGSSLAKLLADELNQGETPGAGWRIFGGNLISQMLQNHHLSETLARFLPEDKVPEMNATIGEFVGLHPNLWDLLQKANATMRELAQGGQVILIGRGANFVTAGITGGTHVRLVAPPKDRARYYAQRYAVPESVALMHNAKCDAARRRYVSANLNANIQDPAAYDLVINTAHVPLAEAAHMVASHIRAHTPMAA